MRCNLDGHNELRCGSRSGALERRYLDQYNTISAGQLCAACHAAHSGQRCHAWTLVITKAMHNSTTAAQPHTANNNIMCRATRFTSLCMGHATVELAAEAWDCIAQCCTVLKAPHSSSSSMEPGCCLVRRVCLQVQQHVQAGSNGDAAVQSTIASIISTISSTSVESPLRLSCDASAMFWRHQHCVEFVTHIDTTAVGA